MSAKRYPEDLIDENGLLKQLTKAHIGSSLQAEMANTLSMISTKP